MTAAAAPVITRVSRDDLAELLPLMRGYCDFYGVAPTDDELLAMSRALIDDPAGEGLQLIARTGDAAVGFATVFWSWSTLSASRIGVMNDLFVVPERRASGIGRALITACRERCREHGAATLSWQTARDNERAQALYDGIGAHREQWLDYSLPAT